MFTYVIDISTINLNTLSKMCGKEIDTLSKFLLVTECRENRTELKVLETKCRCTIGIHCINILLNPCASLD